MHLEIQVALNFVMSYLYNKLPRRRVNIFGEELEKALKAKFEGHWYPEKPCRGSAFRCLKTSNPVDPVLCIAARESGMDLDDIREHLPQDMSVWIDPGEVSYRIGEKGQFKVLLSEKRGGLFGIGASMGLTGSVSPTDDLALELEKDTSRSLFNPEAQAFKPSGGMGSAMDGLAGSLSSLRVASPTQQQQSQPQLVAPSILASPPKPTVTFTTAAFAQTKFGSTKLKNSSKRPNRMSPTEFSHYIKQRALMQQQQKLKYVGMGGMTPSPVQGMTQQSPPGMRQFQQMSAGGQNGSGLFPRPRSLSPISFDMSGPNNGFGLGVGGSGPNGTGGGTSPLSYLADLKSAPVPAGISPFPDTTGLWQPPTASDLLGGLQSSSGSSNGSASPPPLISLPPLQPAPNLQNFGGYGNFGSDNNQMMSGNGGNNNGNGGFGDLDINLGALASYGNNSNNYQHLLVAN